MTITLTDIPAAVTTYLRDHVTILLSDVTPDSGSLNPSEEGTYTMTATNAAAPTGVALRNVVYHFTTTKPAKMLLKVPAGAALTPRAGLSTTSAVLTRNSFVEEMFLTFTFGLLDIGEENELTLEVKGIDEGNVAITVHMHADVDDDKLFARQLSPTATRDVVVS